jgi:fumarate hydratase class II
VGTGLNAPDAIVESHGALRQLAVSLNKIANSAHRDRTTLKEEAIRPGYVTEQEYDEWVRPETMTGPA